MSEQVMDWQRIAHLDPFLAGSIAARGWEWHDARTAESEADSVGLTGERRVDFLRGWQHEIAEQEKERSERMLKEYDEMAIGWDKGDPAR